MTELTSKAAFQNGNVRFARKPESWTEAPGVADRVALVEARRLPRFPAGAFPCSGFGEERPQFFVAVQARTGREFLVNTEGYGYARYVASLPDLPDEAWDAMNASVLEAQMSQK